MTRPRLSTVRLRQLTEELPARYIAPLSHLARVRLLTGAQLDRLLAEPGLSAETVGRVRRRIMARLAHLGLASMLERRIGGVRAGSAGHVYTLTTAGHRFLALLGGKPLPARTQPSRNPGELFLAHALAISGIYVDLIEKSSHSGCRVTSFITEPRMDGGHLRPDAYVVLRAATHADCWWLEIDTGTETTPRLRTKIRTYTDYLNAGNVGPDGVPPRILFVATAQERATIISSIAATLTDADWITATTHADAAQFLASELANT